MSYSIYRVEKDGTRTLVTFVPDLIEVGPAIAEDRDKIDYEVCYEVKKEK